MVLVLAMNILRLMYRNQMGDFDPNTWHKWVIYWPARSIHGKLVFGDVWRKKAVNGWQYQPCPETFEEFWDRQI